MDKLGAPAISIILPVYKVESYLPRCLASIQAQTFASWECICVDDGSPDKSGAILDECAARDERFVVIHQQNGGTSRARNAGLDAARGEYIGFVDPDDWIEPNAYELAIDAARRTGADIVQWGYIEEAEEGGAKPALRMRLPEGFFNVMQNDEYYTASLWNKLFRRALVVGNSVAFPPGVRMGQDVAFTDMSYAFAGKCFFIDRQLYHYVLRSTSVTHNQTALLRIEKDEALKGVYKLIEDNAVGKSKKELSAFLFERKIAAKRGYLFLLPRPEFSLFRSTFPETNKRMLRYFLKERTAKALVMLFVVLRLDWVADAFFWAKRKFRAKS